MKKTIIAAAFLGVLTACSKASDRGQQLFPVSEEDFIRVAVHGVPAISPVLPTTPPGEAGHRIVQSPDGQVLFAYDLGARTTADGGFLLRLIPVKTAPSFRVVREIEVGQGETAAVDILENIRTGEKVYDDFRLFHPKRPKALPGLSSLLRSLGFGTAR